MPTYHIIWSWRSTPRCSEGRRWPLGRQARGRHSVMPRGGLCSQLPAAGRVAARHPASRRAPTKCGQKRPTATLAACRMDEAKRASAESFKIVAMLHERAAEQTGHGRRPCLLQGGRCRGRSVPLKHACRCARTACASQIKRQVSAETRRGPQISAAA
jgi:hypothetical protein